MTMRCRTHEGIAHSSSEVLTHSSSEVLTVEDTVLNSNEYILIFDHYFHRIYNIGRVYFGLEQPRS